jgi:hypothetical protein
MKRWQVFMGVLAILLAVLACGQPAQEWQLRGWTVTPSLTPSVANTLTPTVPTQTPFIVVISQTPEPTKHVLAKCVQADVMVHLRPSANTSGYPIEVLANGERIVDLGGRVGKWWFVSHGSNQGWVDSDYLTPCH